MEHRFKYIFSKKIQMEVLSEQLKIINQQFYTINKTTNIATCVSTFHEVKVKISISCNFMCFHKQVKLCEIYD